MASSATVHTGLWNNHQFNSVEGATLTLTATNASYLVAFLALFLGIVAGHFWAILSYTIFQIRSTLASRNGQHHQQQAILRNYHAPGAAIWQLFLAFWTWRRQKGLRSIFPALPVVALALVSVLAFAAAGILSARVTSKVSDVLIKSDNCGFWVSPDLLDADEQGPDAILSYTANYAEDVRLASTMAAACQKNSSVASECVSYAPNPIEWTTTVGSHCPFDKKICYNNVSVRFDTGMIESTKHLGINAAKQDRFFFRNVVECAPLTREEYVSDWHELGEMEIAPGNVEGNVLTPAPGEGWLEWYYGPSLYMGLNSTFMYSNRTPTMDTLGLPLWSIDALSAVLENAPGSDFAPISELNRTDSDINVMFLYQKKELEYSKPVNDPWFEANTPVTREYETDDVNNGTKFKNVTVYTPSSPVLPLACAFQYQFCDPSVSSVPNCTDLTGIMPAYDQSGELFKRDKQRDVGKRMAEVVGVANSFKELISNLKGNLLQINQYGFYQMAGLKDDYWIVELNHMMATLMKLYQIRNYRYTGGYSAPLNYEPVITPPLDKEKWMCDAQIVKREDYQSLSVLGLALIISIGALIILINLTLDSFVGWYQKKYNKRLFATREWELLQAETLQQQLYKAHGMDLREEDVSIGTVLEKVENRRRVKTFATLVDSERQLNSMSSMGSLDKGSMANTSVRRIDTERTMPASPLLRHD